MSDIINIGAAQLPAFLRTADVAKLASDLTAGVAASYAVISIKGKTWAIVKSKVRNVIVDAEREPVRSIKVVLLKANANVSKVYYEGGYEEGSDDKPTCYSNDGIAPAADAEAKQSAKCATCKWNQWGSHVTEGGKQGKACSDARRVAIAPADLKAEPMLLRVPPASLRNFADYGQALADKRIPYNAVVTKLSFDADAAHPKIKLTFDGFLDEATYQRAVELADSEQVQAIIAKGSVPLDEGTSTQENFDDHDRAAAPVATPAPAPALEKPKATRKAAPAPAPAPVEDAGGFGFGAPEEAAPAPVAAQPTSAAPVDSATADSALEAELAKALSGFGG